MLDITSINIEVTTLLEDLKKGNVNAAEILRENPKFHSDEEIFRAAKAGNIEQADLRRAIARKHGYDSWDKLVRCLSRPVEPPPHPERYHDRDRPDLPTR